MSEKPKIVKCLVWDLDNTLWKGTLVEDGEVSIAQEIRDLVVELDSRGILQSVASKNDHDEAWARLEALGISEYFILPKINWGPKSNSVKAIADELKFDVKTIAFIDDTPAERAEVNYHLPEVRCYSAEQVLEIAELPDFTPEFVTEDSTRRREMYQASFRRDAEKDTFAGPDEDFLRSLELEMANKRADEIDLARVEELTLRTSQMNATGIHYSDEMLRALLNDDRHEVLTVTLNDRFGPHGAVGVMVLEYHRSVWQLKLLATSCRVVSFGAGAVILNWLIDNAARAGVHLSADFRRTDRNRMMDIAYRFAGFTNDGCECVTELDEHSEADIQCLHLIAEQRGEPTTMTLTSPDLAAEAPALS